MISQSFIKEMRYYNEGESCGVLMRERWVNGRLIDNLADSESVALGVYFEYCLLGSLPKSGKIPQAKFKANCGPANGVQGMLAAYRMVHDNVARVRDMWAKAGLVVAKSPEGKLLAGVKYEKGEYSGTIDVVLQATRDVQFENFSLKKGDLIIVDIKYSGMLHDSYSVHGWQFSEKQKRYHGTQAKQYTYVASPEGGEYLPFFFLVVDPNGDYIKWFRIVGIDSDIIETHLKEGKELREQFDYLASMDMLEPRPGGRCEKCALRSECEFKSLLPEPTDISIV